MIVLYILLGAVGGAAVGFLVRQSMAGKKIGSAEARAEKILEEAHRKEKDLLLDAKSRSLEIIDQAKKQEQEFRSQIVRFEERIDRREKELDQKTNVVEKQKADLETKGEQIKQIQEEIKDKRLGRKAIKSNHPPAKPGALSL